MDMAIKSNRKYLEVLFFLSGSNAAHMLSFLMPSYLESLPARLPSATAWSQCRRSKKTALRPNRVPAASATRPNMYLRLQVLLAGEELVRNAKAQTAPAAAMHATLCAWVSLGFQSRSIPLGKVDAEEANTRRAVTRRRRFNPNSEVPVIDLWQRRAECP